MGVDLGVMGDPASMDSGTSVFIDSFSYGFTQKSDQESARFILKSLLRRKSNSFQ